MVVVYTVGIGCTGAHAHMQALVGLHPAVLWRFALLLFSTTHLSIPEAGLKS